MKLSTLTLLVTALLTATPAVDASSKVLAAPAVRGHQPEPVETMAFTLNKEAAIRAIKSYYARTGEWAGAFVMTSVIQWRVELDGKGGWTVHLKYNYEGIGTDYTGADRSGESGWDMRTFALLPTADGGCRCVGMGEYMSARF